MFDIFEQPWTLVGMAVLVLFGMLTFRSICPEKRRWWQLLVPVFIATAGFGLDFIVKTDLEKITAVINISIKAVEEENCNAIAAIISDNYRDSYHDTKEHLMAHCRMKLTPTLVAKNKKRFLVIKVSPPTAAAVLTVLTTFEKESYAYQNLKRTLLIKIRLHLQKEQNKGWLINCAELLELDRQPARWRDIR